MTTKTRKRKKVNPALRESRLAKHLAQKLATQRQRREDGICVSCPRPSMDGFVRCSDCRERHRQDVLVKAQERRAAGICASCKRPALEGHTRCQACQDKRRTGKRVRPAPEEVVSESTGGTG